MKRAFKFIVLVFAALLVANPLCYCSNLTIKNMHTANAAEMANNVMEGDEAIIKLQSYNYSSMYIRHADYDVRIDENVTPEIDSQWRLVPGLANQTEGYISIQSVNYPNYFLRHWEYDFVLEKNDGTSSFAADATFKLVKGLAEASYTSFQSYNFPSRYIRHYEKLLKLEEISTDLDRQDATFRMINLSENSDQPEDAVIVTNPIVRQRADPWVYKHTDGYYYMTASVPEYDRIELRRARTIQGLSTATPITIWRRHSSGIMGGHIWAPEIHFIDGRWYIYFTAGTSSNRFDIRLYVLECSDSNPVTGTWIERGQLKTNWESFTLDATIFEHNGIRYLVWAQQDSKIASNSNIYIAKMNGPLSIIGNQVMIATPQYSWEKIGYAVNEGPAIIKRNGRIFMTFSASATDSNYCMGLLTASDTSNLLDPKSWYKSPNPVFQTNTSTSQYGPGHNSFTTSPDGKVDIMIYHARNYRNITGDPLYDPNRHTRAQKVSWNADGTPNFGIPVADGTNIIYTPAQTPKPTPTPIPTSTPTKTTTDKLIYGDLNGDRAVNSIDFALMRSYLLGISSTLPAQNWKIVGDLNLDGNINSIDFAMFRMYLLGIIQALPHTN